jgi:hypothetical protein
MDRKQIKQVLNNYRNWVFTDTVIDFATERLANLFLEEALTKRERDDDAEEMQDILEETFLQSEDESVD